MYNREKKYDPELDYSAIADGLAKEGRWGEAYDKIYGITDSRLAKIRDTGYDHGRTNENVWQDLLTRYGGEGKDPYVAALRGEAASRYSPGKNDEEYARLVDYVKGTDYGGFTRGEGYKALSDRYASAGRRAMQDTLGQVSARTGGLASSYAESAAQQRYDDYMSQLEDAARKLYESERSEAIKNAELAKGLADRDYERYTADRKYRKAALDDLLSYAYKDEARASEAAEKKAAEEKAAAKEAETAGKPRITAAQTLAALKEGVINGTTRAAYEYYFGQPYGAPAPEKDAVDPEIRAFLDGMREEGEGLEAFREVIDSLRKEGRLTDRQYDLLIGEYAESRP